MVIDERKLKEAKTERERERERENQAITLGVWPVSLREGKGRRATQP